MSKHGLKNVAHPLKRSNLARGFENRIFAARCHHAGLLITVSPSRGLAQRTAPLACGCPRALAHTQPALARSAPHTHASACTHKPRTEQLSIRVQATHRPGSVPMPPLRKVSSATVKDSNKGSSAGASSSRSQRASQSFRAYIQKSGKVAGGDAGMGPGDAPGAAGKKASRTAGKKLIRT
jgi:hypothetical protein